jgi:tRNA dimethylallyltransferase
MIKIIPKVIVILGPTASGKSDIAVTLARKFGGEVISADSRQVYKGLDIGTGKITKKEMKGVPHHLLDMVNPNRQFTAAKYINLASKAITGIFKRGKLPIICGGTGFYIAALLGEVNIPEAGPNIKLRKQLEKKSVIALFEILKRTDPERARDIANKNEKQNKRRLIRAIEIAKALGPNSAKATLGKKVPNYNTLKIGIKLSDNELRRKINRRIDKRLKQGLTKEVENLHQSGLSWKRMAEIGLEYRIISQFLVSRTGLDTSALKKALGEKIWQYAKRQKTWFKRDPKIIWLSPKIRTIEKQVSKFLKSH